VRAAGWALALQAALAGEDGLVLVGPEGSPVGPPARQTPTGPRPLSPSQLSFPRGGTPHDFLRIGPDGVGEEVDRFQTVRPDVTLRARDGSEILVELDDRLPDAGGRAKLERYDHFLSGWATALARYSRAPLPLVAFICRDRERARRCARAADGALRAARAYPGEYPSAWDYPGRGRIVFAAERDVYEGTLAAWGVAPLPPAVRYAGGGPAAREPLIEARELALPRQR
jgi:hypothetical protein